MQCAVKVQVCTLNVSNLNDQYIFGVPPRRELCLSTLPFHNKSRENAAPASRPAASYNRIGQLYIEDLFVYRKLGGGYMRVPGIGVWQSEPEGILTVTVYPTQCFNR